MLFASKVVQKTRKHGKATLLLQREYPNTKTRVGIYNQKNMPSDDDTPT